MNLYVTSFKSIDPDTGRVVTYGGPHVPGISEADARDYCKKNGLDHLEILGVLIMEVPCKPGTYDPDWDKREDHDFINN